MVRKLASTSKYREYGFRLYETCQGARVMVLGKDFDPRDRETGKMMSEFNCDRLYLTLCQKQACFRARLTPKSQRMKMRRYKIQFPRQGDDSDLQQWLADYERESRNYSVCKFIEQVGARHYVNEIIQIHDELTGQISANRWRDFSFPQKLEGNQWMLFTPHVSSSSRCHLIS